MRKAAQEIAPFDLLALRPADTPAYMTEAWLSCLLSVSRSPGAREAFVHLLTTGAGRCRAPSARDDLSQLSAFASRP